MPKAPANDDPIRMQDFNSVFHPSGGSRKLYNLLNLHSIYSHEAELLLNSIANQILVLKGFVYCRAFVVANLMSYGSVLGDVRATLEQNGVFCFEKEATNL